MNYLDEMLKDFGSPAKFIEFKTYKDISDLVSKLNGSCWIVGSDIVNLFYIRTGCYKADTYYIKGVNPSVLSNFIKFLNKKDIKNEIFNISMYDVFYEYDFIHEDCYINDGFGRVIRLRFIDDISKIVEAQPLTIYKQAYDIVKNEWLIDKNSYDDLNSFNLKVHNENSFNKSNYLPFNIAKNVSTYEPHNIDIFKDLIENSEYDCITLKNIFLDILPLYNECNIVKYLNNVGISNKLFSMDLKYTESITRNPIVTWFSDIYYEQSENFILPLTKEEIRAFKINKNDVSEDVFPTNILTKSEATSYRYSYSSNVIGNRYDRRSYAFHLFSIPIAPCEIKWLKISDFTSRGVPRKKVDEVKLEICRNIYYGRLTYDVYSMLKFIEEYSSDNF